MPEYMLHLENHPDGERAIRPYKPPTPRLHKGDVIEYDGMAWRVVALAYNQEHDLCIVRALINPPLNIGAR